MTLISSRTLVLLCSLILADAARASTAGVEADFEAAAPESAMQLQGAARSFGDDSDDDGGKPVDPQAERPFAGTTAVAAIGDPRPYRQEDDRRVGAPPATAPHDDRFDNAGR